MHSKSLLFDRFFELVPATGLEPVQCYLLEPESSASANSATRASNKINHFCAFALSDFPIAPHRFQLCKPYRAISRVPGTETNHLSKDGKWRSFPKVPHLLQYVTSGNYFGKVKIKRTTIRQSLETTVWSTAQLKLNDLLKEHRENRDEADPPKFSEAVEIFKRELANDTTISRDIARFRQPIRLLATNCLSGFARQIRFSQ